MSLVFDFYVPRDAWLHRLDPRVKLWGTLLGFFTAFLLPGLPAQVAFLIGLHLLLLVNGIPWSVLGRLWRQMAILLVLIFVLQPFFAPAGQDLVALGPLRWTTGGIVNALLLIARTMALACVVGALLFTTDQRALVRAFVRLGAPYTWGLTFSLTLRFLPAIQHLFIAVREAQAARGWVAEGNLVQRFREYLPVLVAVIIGTLRTSDRLTLALAARGLATSTQRTVWHDLRMRNSDWFALTGIMLAFGALVWWRFVLTG